MASGLRRNARGTASVSHRFRGAFATRRCSGHAAGAAGEPVNVEIDVVAKYVERLVRGYDAHDNE